MVRSRSRSGSFATIRRDRLPPRRLCARCKSATGVDKRPRVNSHRARRVQQGGPRVLHRGPVAGAPFGLGAWGMPQPQLSPPLFEAAVIFLSRSPNSACPSRQFVKKDCGGGWSLSGLNCGHSKKTTIRQCFLPGTASAVPRPAMWRSKGKAPVGGSRGLTGTSAQATNSVASPIAYLRPIELLQLPLGDLGSMCPDIARRSRTRDQS